MTPLLLTADLLFVVGSVSGFSQAITDATAPGEALPYDHVALLYIDATGAANVIEASPAAGVRMVPLADFLEAAPRVDGKPGVVVMRLDADFIPMQAVSNAIGRIGEEYDWWYLPNNGKSYCSELIYESYVDSDGNHIFETKPMNFRAPDGSMPDFWINLYDRLGIPVPEGVPGTNPQDISKHQNLTEIHRFF